MRSSGVGGGGVNCLLLPEGGEQMSKKEKIANPWGCMLGRRGMVTSQTEPGINNGNFQKENLGNSNCDGN